MNYKNVMIRSIILLLLCLPAFMSVAQEQLKTSYMYDFEKTDTRPWMSFGNEIVLTNKVAHEGKQSLEIKYASSAEYSFRVVPNSTYRITAWVKTSSGSDLVEMNIDGLSENNVSAASARTDWTELKKDFNVGEGQTHATLEILNADNPGKNSAWADDIRIERISDYASTKVAGIKPFPERTPKMDQGIRQQLNEKLNWFLDAKFGMFIHWGLYAGPAKGEWYMNKQGMSPEEYRKFAYPESGDQYFAADKFDAGAWAKLAKDAGMKYMCLTTMHHDGYALFDSQYMNAFSSKQTLNRDFVKEYVDSCRKYGLKVGIYKTLINWRYPGYYDVTGTDCKPNKFGYTTDISHKENARLMKEDLYCDIKQLMTQYGKIDQLFWDGGWLGQQGSDADGAYFWESGKYLDPNNEWPVNPYFQIDDDTGKPLGIMGMVRKYQPDIIVNPRCGWYGDYKSEEGGAAVTGPIRSEEYYEKCMTIGGSWGYSRAMEDSTKIRSVDQIKRMLSDCVIRNITLLLNVGPDRHGQISKPVTKVLLATGKWLKQVGEAVYDTRGGPWNPKDGQYGFTYKDNTIYVYLLDGFEGETFTLPALNIGQKVVNAYVVSDKKTVKFKQNKKREISLTGFEHMDKAVTIIAVELNGKLMEN
ncbi:MAG TPA: alpha-L-fucosidase [Prolixibacteraceae bacterium]|nr:alpha-L-fucosidase [Prolixibacteraceae bacterium]